MKISSLSANTLFHFTDHIDKLESILSNEFYPHFCLENQEHIGQVIFEGAFPMVCFCDIPLSQIQAHTVYYGNYAIGLKKEWGIENKICPVLYTYKNSSTAINLNAIFKELNTYNINEKVLDFGSYVKNYKGKLWRNNRYVGMWKDGKFTDDKINFYDEREWRYVPEIDTEKDGIKKFIEKADFKDKYYIDPQNEKLKSKKLSFEPKDIKYIIVNKESEILAMFERVKQIKGDKYKPDDIKKLQTRIISMEHIREDF